MVKKDWKTTSQPTDVERLEDYSTCQALPFRNFRVAICFKTGQLALKQCIVIAIVNEMEL